MFEISTSWPERPADQRAGRGRRGVPRGGQRRSRAPLLRAESVRRSPPTAQRSRAMAWAARNSSGGVMVDTCLIIWLTARPSVDNDAGEVPESDLMLSSDGFEVSREECSIGERMRDPGI